MSAELPEYGHFPDHEIACPCCGKLPPADVLGTLRERLEAVRRAVNAPIAVHSAYRCKKHNKEVGGAVNSRHLIGDAADIHAVGVDLLYLYNTCLRDQVLSSGGLAIKAGHFVHIDCGPKRRWEYG